MTVSSAISRHDYTGSGTLDTYPFEFEIYVKTDLDVYVSGVLQTVDVHYAISGTAPKYGLNDPNGGNVVFKPAHIPANNAPIAIILDLPLTQLINYVEGDKFPAETHERALDRLVKIAQAFKTRMAGILKVPVWSALVDIIIEPGSKKYLRWNEAGDKIEAVTLAEGSINNHHATHEAGGSDLVSVTGLSGLLADDQHVLDAEVLALAGIANGLASLDATTQVPIAQMASGTPDGTKFIRDDRTLAVPSAVPAGLKFLTTPINKIAWTAVTDWTDVDISADTGTDTAKAALIAIEIYFLSTSGEASTRALFRKNGSSETTVLPRMATAAFQNTQVGRNGGTFIVECDASEIFEAKLATLTGTPASIGFYVDLIGYWI